MRTDGWSPSALAPLTSAATSEASCRARARAPAGHGVGGRICLASRSFPVFMWWFREALTHGVNPLHLALVVGIDEKTAIRYVDSARALLGEAAEQASQ